MLLDKVLVPGRGTASGSDMKAMVQHSFNEILADMAVQLSVEHERELDALRRALQPRGGETIHVDGAVICSGANSLVRPVSRLEAVREALVSISDADLGLTKDAKQDESIAREAQVEKPLVCGMAACPGAVARIDRSGTDPCARLTSTCAAHTALRTIAPPPLPPLTPPVPAACSTAATICKEDDLDVPPDDSREFAVITSANKPPKLAEHLAEHLLIPPQCSPRGVDKDDSARHWVIDEDAPIVFNQSSSLLNLDPPQRASSTNNQQRRASTMESHSSLQTTKTISGKAVGFGEDASIRSPRSLNRQSSGSEMSHERSQSMMHHVSSRSPFRYPVAPPQRLSQLTPAFPSDGASARTSISQFAFHLRPEWRMPEERIIELANLRMVKYRNNATKIMLNGGEDSHTVGEKAGPQTCDRWPSLMLHPQSVRRLIWDISFMLFVVYDLIYLPLQAFSIKPSTFTSNMQVACTIFWTLDMVMTCFTGTYVHEDLVMNQQTIVWRYMRTWFVIDLSLVLPQWVLLCLGIDEDSDLGSKGSGLKIFGIIRILRFLRLVRVWKFKHVMLDLQYLINSTSVLLVISLVRQMVSIIFLNHWIACMWFGISAGETDGWVQKVFGDKESTIEDQYLTSFQWSVAQLQGSTNIYPACTTEYIVSIVVLLCTLLIFSSFLSSITNTMQQLRTLSAEAHREQYEVRKFLRDHQISIKLAVRVKKFVDWRTSAKLTPESDVAILKVLPSQMLVDIHQEIRAPVMTHHFFFSTLQSVFPRVLRQICHEAVDQHIFSISDNIFFAGDASSHMYFGAKGHLRYTLVLLLENREIPEMCKTLSRSLSTNSSHRSGGSRVLSKMRSMGSRESNAFTELSTLRSAEKGVRSMLEQEEFVVQENEWLGEPVLWTAWEHHGDLVAVSNVVVLTVSAASFADTLQVHPAAHGQAVIYARGLINHLNRAPIVSDIFGYEGAKREYGTTSTPTTNFARFYS